jgi:hypothetical protein
MAILGVDDFKAKIKGGGARPNLFKVTLNYPAFAQGDVELTSFLVRAATLPESLMSMIPVPFRGRELKVAGVRTFQPWTTQVYNDTDFNVRNALERWSNAINAHSSNVGLTNPVDYQADLIVEQLDRDETVLKTYNFRGAFPEQISQIDLAYEANDQIEVFDCVWQYQYWESNTTT